MAICPSYIGARRMRVTRLDECGRPVYGPCSQVVSDGFVSIEFSPEIEEGEDYTQRNAAGDLCVSERGQDALTWISISIEFCKVDAELWQIMNPTWKTVTNAQGVVTGFRIGEKFSDSLGFALEVWPKATGQAALCDEDAPENANPNGYFLLPYVIGGAPESWTLEDGVATFTLNGRTKAGSLWGRGPYNITHNAQGNPSPLLQPIDSGAQSGEPDHFHADIVTLAPPPAQCGCQPLEALAPGAEGDEITLAPSQPNRACFTVSGSPGRRVTIDWGDNSSEVTSRVGREECHLYTSTGTYTVTVSDVDDPDKSNTYEVTVNEAPPLPAPTATVHYIDRTNRRIEVEVNNHGNGQVTIDWGDGTPVQNHPGGNDTGTVRHPHQYGAYGTYTITVSASADPRATVDVEADLPAPAPNQPTNLAVGNGSITQTGFTVTWSYNQGNVVASGFEVRYREVGTTDWTVDPATNATARSHPITGLTAGTEYEAQVRSISSAGGQSAWTDSVTATTTAPAMTIDAPATGTVDVPLDITVDNQGQGTVTIDWGDETATSTNPGDGSTASDHTYTAAATYTITVTDDDSSRTATHDVEIAAEMVLDAPATATTGEDVVVTVNNQGQGPVTIDWGNDSGTSANSGDGDEVSTQTYTAAGTYTITVTDDDDATRTASQAIEITAA